MASITIRNLDERTKARLRLRAARHGRSMEEEVRSLLRSALGQDAARERRLGDIIRARFQRLGGIELELPPREGIREPPGVDR
jgi:plasmid stability protein